MIIRLKKLPALCGLAAVFLPLLALAARDDHSPAAPESQVQLEIPELSAMPDETLDVPVLLRTDAALSLLAFSLEFDPAVLELTGPVLDPDVLAILERVADAESSFEWFAGEGWVQVFLVLDFQGREEFTLPPGLLRRVLSVGFHVLSAAAEGRTALSFTRPETAAYEGHLKGPAGSVYNAVRRAGKPFTPETVFEDPVEPGLTDGGIVISILGDVGIFVRGDVNTDGNIDVSDPIGVLDHLFFGDDPFSCEDAADANDDGRIDISDPITILDFLFGGTASSAISPSRERVRDETPDSLTCSRY